MGRAGGVQVRENSIRITFSFEGKQHHRTVVVNGSPLAPTLANISYAKRLAAEIKDKVRLGLFSFAEYFPANGDTAQVVTVVHQLQTWLAAQRIEGSTRAGYESAIRFWSVLDKPVKGLKLSDILRVLAGRPELSGKTVNNYVSVLREALQLAVQDRCIEVNPALGVPRAKWQKEPPDPLSRDEAELVVGSLAERHSGQVHNLVDFWLWTGLRTSEIFALRWGDVDLVSGLVVVRSAVVRGVRKETTKTAVARQVNLNSRALAAIKRQKQHTFLAGDEVFNDPRYGKPWVDERAFRRSFWTPTLKRLGIRYRRPYNMRHTYATAMLMAGMTPAFCAKQLGHSVEMFLRTYSRWVDGVRNDAEMARLEASLCPSNAWAAKRAKKG